MIKILIEDYGAIGKKGGWISRIDVALDVANNTIFPLSAIENLKIESLQARKRRFNRFDERCFRVTCWVLMFRMDWRGEARKLLELIARI